MRNLLMAAVLLLGGAIVAAAAPAADPAALVADASPLHVRIDRRPYDLEAFALRRPGTDKLPVALITHGALPGNPRGVTIDPLRAWADEMAQRGWLAIAVMRRGYGRSTGEAHEDTSACASPDVGGYLAAHADDLAAALVAIAHRPDADMSRVVVIGDSAGGAAAMALAARPSAHVAAVINISGGLAPRQLGPFQPDPRCGAYSSDLVWNFAKYGATAHMPTLWLYAENDSLFRPGLVARMRAAFTGSGGKVDLAMLPPFGADGHTMFFADGGRQVLMPEIDRFLRANGLPTWDEAAFAPLREQLSTEARETLAYYLRSLPTEKALALAPSGHLYWREGGWRLAAVRDAVLSDCHKATGEDCRLVAEDFHPISLDGAGQQ